MIKFYYIDDDPQTTIVETAKGLSILPDKLQVSAFQHKKWDDQISFITEYQESFDGLILDWSLNNKNAEGENANYNVEALAQQIRRFIIDKDRIKKDFPIVLCSANYKFREIFSKELTGHDLFDLVFEKDDFDSKQKIIISQLEDLAIGYKTLTLSNSPKDIFGIGNLEELDYRILDHVQNQNDAPLHELARFVLTNIINTTGVLIDNYLLAARLGVDIIDTPDLAEWEKLLVIFAESKYKGVFSNGWNRWWMNKVTLFWEQTFGCSIGSLLGEEKVRLMNEKFGLKLTPAKVFEYGTSSAFWVICKANKRPLAIDDAILSSSEINKCSWEEDQYFSVSAALDEDIRNIHILEKERVNSLKEHYTKIRGNERKNN
jgi:hypothetical protein